MTGKGYKILIVDDDEASCRTLQLHMQNQGYRVTVAHSVDEGLKKASSLKPNLLVLDIRMPGKSGLEGLPEFKKQISNMHVIMITAFHDMESTIQAMQKGADDYIHKPIDINEFDNVISRLLTTREKRDILQSTDEHIGDNTMVGSSNAMKEVFKTIGMVAANPVTVLIGGESGTGKELVARAIHRSSKNPDGPFVAINCAALVETLLESDMFGHEKGAFTGAVQRQLGKFALANNGTIFLDEVSELSPAMQAKLLRVLEEKEFTPLGAKAPQKTNARIITASNLNLETCVKENKFREDLYYRLRVVVIDLPPLRDRREDIMDLVRALLYRINTQMHRDVTQLSTDAINCLQRYDWPGNVRELENTLAKAVALCPGNLITSDLIGDICQATSTDQDDKEEMPSQLLKDIEQSHVLTVLKSVDWHKGKACKILGISRPRLRRMIKESGITPPEHAASENENEGE